MIQIPVMLNYKYASLVNLSSVAPTMSSMIFLHMWKHIKNIHIKYGNPFSYYYPNKPVMEHAFFITQCPRLGMDTKQKRTK